MTIPLITLDIRRNGGRWDVWLCGPSRELPVAVGFPTERAAYRVAWDLTKEASGAEFNDLWHRLDQRVGYDAPAHRYVPPVAV